MLGEPLRRHNAKAAVFSRAQFYTDEVGKMHCHTESSIPVHELGISADQVPERLRTGTILYVRLQECRASICRMPLRVPLSVCLAGSHVH